MINVKICGITRLQDALSAIDAGADAIGFIFYKPSKRFIETEVAEEISYHILPFVARVGVFVNESVREIIKVSKQVGLTHVQLHGSERPDDFKDLPLPIIRAVNFSEKLNDEFKKWPQAFRMVDGGNNKIHGGTGQAFPWEQLKNILSDTKIILAGGLTVDNVQQAIRIVRPWAVDVSSGVESSPGIKDKQLIKKFISNVKSNIPN